MMGASSGGVCGHVDDMIGFAADGFVPFGRQGDDHAAARLGLLHLADHLVVEVVFGDDGDDRHVFVDEGDGAVFHLPGRVAFGVDVADLFELERAFEGDGVVDATAEIEEVGGLEELVGQLLVFAVAVEDAAGQVGQVGGIADQLTQRSLRSACRAGGPGGRPAGTDP